MKYLYLVLVLLFVIGIGVSLSDTIETFDSGNCQQSYSRNLDKILTNETFSQSMGYTPIKQFYNTQYIETDKPLPVDPDFFYLLTSK